MMKRKKGKNDPNKLPKNFGKLMYAGDYDRIKEIFKTCSLEATFGFEEVTAIFFATMAGTDEMVEWLAEQGADINARDRWGQTPICTNLTKMLASVTGLFSAFQQNNPQNTQERHS